MRDIDEEARFIGISPEVWEQFRSLTSGRGVKDRDLPLERELPPPRMEQMEFESIVNPIDDREAEQRHRQAMAHRWFGYYKKCTDQSKKSKLIDQYNSLAKPKERD